MFIPLLALLHSSVLSIFKRKYINLSLTLGFQRVAFSLFMIWNEEMVTCVIPVQTRIVYLLCLRRSHVSFHKDEIPMK